MLGAWWTTTNGFQHKTSTNTWVITLALLDHWHSQKKTLNALGFADTIYTWIPYSIYLFIYFLIHIYSLIHKIHYTSKYTELHMTCIYIFPQYHPTQFTIFNRLAQLFEPVLYTGPNISNNVNFVILSHLWNVFLQLILAMILFINSNCKSIVDM